MAHVVKDDSGKPLPIQTKKGIAYTVRWRTPEGGFRQTRVYGGIRKAQELVSQINAAKYKGKYFDSVNFDSVTAANVIEKFKNHIGTLEKHIEVLEERFGRLQKDVAKYIAHSQMEYCYIGLASCDVIKVGYSSDDPQGRLRSNRLTEILVMSGSRLLEAQMINTFGPPIRGHEWVKPTPFIFQFAGMVRRGVNPHDAIDIVYNRKMQMIRKLNYEQIQAQG